ncbi:extensin-like domain-containing protein [Jannaschia formosa]|uniref:extensin-like domain-containing protein n=1 Tax=Jannaschia formosa TaxID=2259592 RepID=UPI001431C711|nr:extensin family protein [Jannaschia formosa]
MTMTEIDRPHPILRPAPPEPEELRRALMAPDAAPAPRRRRPWRLLAEIVPTLLSLAALIGAGFWLLTAPDTPLAPEWNPTEALDLTHPVTPLTGFKLRRALAGEESCLAALSTGAAFEAMAPLRSGESCGIVPRVDLRGVGGAWVAPVETTCGTALRLAMWEKAVVAEAGALLGSPVAGLSHQGSYNCRAIRGGERMSSHANALAIDINGVVLEDGRRLPLLDNWEGEGPEARFWRALRDGGCDWFGTVLGPDYDANHADHLHLQSSGRGTCR